MKISFWKIPWVLAKNDDWNVFIFLILWFQQSLAEVSKVFYEEPVTIFDFTGHGSLLHLLYSAFVARNQP